MQEVQEVQDVQEVQEVTRSEAEYGHLKVIFELELDSKEGHRQNYRKDIGMQID